MSISYNDDKTKFRNPTKPSHRWVKVNGPTHEQLCRDLRNGNYKAVSNQIPPCPKLKTRGRKEGFRLPNKAKQVKAPKVKKEKTIKIKIVKKKKKAKPKTVKIKIKSTSQSRQTATLLKKAEASRRRVEQHQQDASAFFADRRAKRKIKESLILRTAQREQHVRDSFAKAQASRNKLEQNQADAAAFFADRRSRELVGLELGARKRLKAKSKKIKAKAQRKASRKAAGRKIETTIRGKRSRGPLKAPKVSFARVARVQTSRAGRKTFAQIARGIN